MKVVPLMVRVPLEVRSICMELTETELLDFIKELDLCVASTDFTEKLRDYFVAEMKKEDSFEGGE